MEKFDPVSKILGKGKTNFNLNKQFGKKKKFGEKKEKEEEEDDDEED